MLLAGASPVVNPRQVAATASPPRGRGGQPGGGGGRQGGGPGLEGSMKGLDRTLESLKASIGDASKKEDNLRLLSDAERFAAGAKGAKPTEALNEAKDDAERAKMMTDYRKQLLSVLKSLIEAEEATMDGHTDKAKAALDKVAEAREKGHKEFKVKEGDKPAGGAPAGGGRGRGNGGGGEAPASK
ncbi:MAG: cytochrome b562 [Phycisphaerales bacterium]